MRLSMPSTMKLIMLVMMLMMIAVVMIIAMMTVMMVRAMMTATMLMIMTTLMMNIIMMLAATTMLAMTMMITTVRTEDGDEYVDHEDDDGDAAHDDKDGSHDDCESQDDHSVLSASSSAWACPLWRWVPSQLAELARQRRKPTQPNGSSGPRRCRRSSASAHLSGQSQ